LVVIVPRVKPAHRRLFTFPDPVNETSARLVAAGVVLMGVAVALLDQHWLLALLAYGFVARVLSGPRFSPLGRVVTQFVTPRLPVRHRLVPGPPKRFAQGIGAVLSVAALVAHLGFGATGLAEVLVGAIVAAAMLEAVFAFCLGCVIFGWLIRVGALPESACADCADISERLAGAGLGSTTEGAGGSTRRAQ
jgi:hypothetical protein